MSGEALLTTGESTVPSAPAPTRRAHHAASDPDAPSAVTGQYLPGLDGLRAMAVSAVFAYHLGLGWASGGYLGVDLFFVLSGFLITSLLLEEWVTTARIRLGAFWARRARRLLPALFVLLAALGVYVVLNGRFGGAGSAGQVNLSELRGDALGTLFYVANWHSIFAHQSYFAQFASPSPLEHTWSLAIEEQFYLVWPLLLLGILTVAPRSWRRVGAAVTVIGALASAGLMALLHHQGADPTRIYFGTDTHAFDMLAGATVAMVAAARPQPGPRARTALHWLGPASAVALAVFWVVAGLPTGLPRSWMFAGGFLCCAVLAAVVVADVRQFHSGLLGTALSLRPLRFLGRISYGVYLWHWPIIVYLNGARTGLGEPWLDLVRIAATLVVATASYYLVERPIRQRRWRGWPRFALAPVAAAVTAVVVVVATIPAVAAPPTHPAITGSATHAGATAAGSGGAVGTVSVPAFGPSDPLRVSVLGDSLARLSEPGIAAALGATGEVKVTNAAFTGFGLNRTFDGHTSSWAIRSLIGTSRPELVLATWSWDGTCSAAAPTPYNRSYTCALQQPKAYAAMLESAVRLLLGPLGASGVVFMEFPTTGPDADNGEQATDEVVARDDAGERAWASVAESMAERFPGKVMYLPVGSSVLWDGTSYTPWLPPVGRPDAPRSTWVRVRMTDGTHLCPAGVARYSAAILSDLTAALHLQPAAAGWATASWTADPAFTAPGACPADHPPG